MGRNTASRQTRTEVRVDRAAAKIHWRFRRLPNQVGFLFGADLETARLISSCTNCFASNQNHKSRPEGRPAPTQSIYARSRIKFSGGDPIIFIKVRTYSGLTTVCFLLLSEAADEIVSPIVEVRSGSLMTY